MFVLDLDGVVYSGDEVLPGAGETLRFLDRAGHRIVFCTNNSSRTRGDIAKKISRLTGFETSENQVLNSAEAAAMLIGPTDARTLIVGGLGVHEALVPLGIRDTPEGVLPDLVVVGLDVDLSYDKLAIATLALREGARFVATNRDVTFPTPRGEMPGAGSIVALLETASGREAECAGKPHRPMRDLIRSRAEGSPITVVGDRPETDLEMAYAEGWRSVLVLTGVAKEAEGSRADLVVPTIGDLIYSL